MKNFLSIISAILFFSLLHESALAQHEFITTWETTTANESIRLNFPYNALNVYNVDWGDGNTQTGLVGDATHTYANAGIHTVTITATTLRAKFSTDKLRSVEQWGDIQWTHITDMFNGCDNIAFNATDAPDFSNLVDTKATGMFRYASNISGDLSNWNMSGVTDMAFMFAQSSNITADITNWDVSNVIHMQSMFDLARDFNQDIGNWDVSSVIWMYNMFANAWAFNQDISGWDVSQVESFSRMFERAFAFNQNLGSWDISGALDGQRIDFDDSNMSRENYDSTLLGWSNLPLLPNDFIVEAKGLSFCKSTLAREEFKTKNNWTFTDDTQDCNGSAFITTWNIQTTNEEIEIPTNGTGYNYTVLWGDGTGDDQVTGSKKHTYAAAGTYQVVIFGDFPAIYFNNTGDKDKITSIDSWGDIQWQSMNSAFEGCTNLTYNATDAPDLSNVTDMSYMFAGASSVNGNFNSWNTSTVTDMSYLFKNATSYNGGVRNWDVSNVTTMEGMFSGASSFNQTGIAFWTPANLVNASYMFENATTYRFSIFKNADNLQNMEGMFKGASAFEGPIYLNLKTSVTNMKDMLKNATSFDRYIGSWNISNVTNMEGMLSGSGLSKENYGRALQDWSEKTLQNGVTLGADGLEYCAGRVERQTIIDTYNWTFVGDAETCPEIVNIPDANFKNRLVTLYDHNGDNEIDVTEAAGVTTHISAQNLSIADLTGIEAFVNITEIYVDENPITSLDLSNNLALTDVYARNCQLSSLNLGNNTVIQRFNADQNDFTTVDLSNYTTLEWIDLSENQLTSIQLPSTSTLGALYLDNNQLEAIDLTGITSVTYLNLSYNALTGIDVSPVTALEILNLSNNNISSEVFGSNAQLTHLYLGYNPLTSVDVSGLSELAHLIVYNTDITTVDVSQNTKLQNLSADNSPLNTLDLSNNTELTGLSIENTELTSLDLSANLKLDLLSATGSKLVELDLSGIPGLDEIFLSGNNLQSLNVASGNTSHEDFVATNNPNLYCVEVSDVTYFETNFPNGIDPQASYSLNCNIVPENIILSNNIIDENNAIGDIIGSFSTTDADTDDTHTYTLVAGTGDADNASFTLTVADLQAAEVFDFETKSSYSIRVQTDDGNGGTYEEVFTIAVTDVNEAPEVISLSANNIHENNAVGDVIGSFSTTDPDAGDTHTYTLVAGTGDADNASFTITGTDLQAAEVFDFETKSSYSIRVQTDDGNGGTYEEVFTIAVTDVNEAPEAISLSANNIDENNSVGDVIGSFSTTDPDAGDTHTYTLVAGEGDNDNASFTINAGQLKAAEVFDYEIKSSYNIRVQTTDGNDSTLESTFTVMITDVDDATNIGEAAYFSNIKIYPNPAAEEVTIEHPAFEKAERIYLLNATGRIVKEQRAGEENTVLEISEIRSGVYFIRIDKGKPFKIIIQ